MKNILSILFILTMTASCHSQESIGKQIRENRFKCQMTLQTLADSIGISSEVLNLIEEDKATLIHTKWAKLERILTFKLKHYARKSK